MKSSGDSSPRSISLKRCSHSAVSRGDCSCSGRTESAGQDSSYPIDPELSLQEAVDEYEKGLIKYACEKYGSTRKAAKAIGISQTQLVRKKKKYNL